MSGTWRQKVRDGSSETFFVNGVVELTLDDDIDPTVLIDLDYISLEDAMDLARKIMAVDNMLQALRDIDEASWEINSKLGERIRGVIRQAEGETK